MTIYQKMLAIRAEIDSHESDLYVKSTPAARAIVRHRSNVTEFRSGGDVWLDIPFAFDPFYRTPRTRSARGSV